MARPRTIVGDGVVVGHVVVFGSPDKQELTYWIDRAHWGHGFATAALGILLAVMTERPLHARAVDNAGSAKVLAKCGVRDRGAGIRGFANVRGEEIEELLFTLR